MPSLKFVKPAPGITAEEKLLMVLEAVFAAFDLGLTWREREGLRRDLHRAIDVFFAGKISEGAGR